MEVDELVKLIGGPYRPPRVRIGDVESCMYRDCDVVITSWNDARIPRPRCRAREHLGGSGLLINETLLKAIRTESAEAIKYWFGVGTHAVWSWRKAFGISQLGTFSADDRVNRLVPKFKPTKSSSQYETLLEPGARSRS